MTRIALCAAATLALALPAFAQDTATTLSAVYAQALAAERQASALVETSGKSFDADDADAGCSGMRDARKVYGEARIAMEDMRDILGSAKDLAPDYQKQGLDWVNTNEPVVDEDMKEIDRIVAGRCERSLGYSTASIDQLLDEAAALMNRGIAANRQSREAFGQDDLVHACNALEAARQNFSDGYQNLSQARSLVQGASALPASIQRQYFDTIDNTQRNADGLATTMSELWRNRCSSR